MTDKTQTAFLTLTFLTAALATAAATVSAVDFLNVNNSFDTILAATVQLNLPNYKPFDPRDPADNNNADLQTYYAQTEVAVNAFERRRMMTAAAYAGVLALACVCVGLYFSKGKQGLGFRTNVPLAAAFVALAAGVAGTVGNWIVAVPPSNTQLMTTTLLPVGATDLAVAAAALCTAIAMVVKR
jgi:hypothetical protein